MKKSILIVILICAGLAVSLYFINRNRPAASQKESPKFLLTGNSSALNTSVNELDFVNAARLATPAVVHIKSTYSNASGQGNRGYGRSAPAMSSGSGVIIASNGYIATNNHVVENATTVQVILSNRREFTAKVVGRDPNTDLALLKIDASGLQVLEFGNSDAVQVGEWVLAVGFPYSLNTTATAGIISAKGRNIGIINSAQSNEGQQATNNAIESFIQTDAAINPGNSGGALVNTSGQLIGINTAIASLTGSYAGYAFAIPVNLAKKILSDLQKFGVVKRGVLGVAFPSPAAENEYLKQMGIAPGSVNGVFITNIQDGSAAASAGLQEGDIIQSINGIQLYSSSEFSERIARHGPGEKIQLTYLRDGDKKEVSVTLKGESNLNAGGNAQSLTEIYKKLGASFAPLTSAVKERFGLNTGVLVTEVFPGGFFGELGIPPGTIIAYINGSEVSTPADIEQALMKAGNGRVQILAVAPDGSKVAFNFSFGA